MPDQTRVPGPLSFVQDPLLASQAYVTAAILASHIGYALHVQALAASPLDGETIYFGGLIDAPSTTAALRRVYVTKAGTLKVAYVFSTCSVSGTDEAWPLSIRLNDTSDTAVASVSAATTERVWSNAALSIAVVPGDYFEMKLVNPTWLVAPTLVAFSGSVYIE